ncbi:MAG: hypothetical protein QE494_10715 [Ramlibacter sp.]|nr:hypothetical protein [Ramlibacter sp.]MDH4376759.1 hypothetical protein [Ramlibacter sp.]
MIATTPAVAWLVPRLLDVDIDLFVEHLDRIDFQLHLALVAGDRVARANIEPEKVPGANDFSFDHPAQAQRAIHMRAAGIEGDDVVTPCGSPGDRDGASFHTACQNSAIGRDIRPCAGQMGRL